MMPDIKSLTLEELKAEAAAMGEQPFRAKQLYQWMHVKLARSFDEMTNLSKGLREKLSGTYQIFPIELVERQISKADPTEKFLFRLWDGNMIESVLMRHSYGNSVCVSSQAGCRMGCRFCASTLAGWVRNLTASEMLDEVYTAQQDLRGRISNVVLMGIGEPLDNFDNVMAFLEILSSREGINLSLRHVSLSTCGLVDGIRALAEKKLQLTLSVSLHAPNDSIRSQSMPVNQRYNMDDLLDACRDYFEQTGRRISFEYALIAGVNDAPAHAEELASRLSGMGAHVNLIPVNPVAETGYRRGKRAGIEAFQAQLERLGVNATIRRELGTDIAAACGQLRRQDTETA